MNLSQKYKLNTYNSSLGLGHYRERRAGLRREEKKEIQGFFIKVLRD